MPSSIYQEWRAGLLTNGRALHALCSDRGEIKSELTPLQDQLKLIEAQISEVVTAIGGKVRVDGTGTLLIRAPTVAYPYDPGALDDLVQSLRETGHGEIAAEIVNCRKAQPRAGGLVITPDKPKPSR
jgi:hypothetical protein